MRKRFLMWFLVGVMLLGLAEINTAFAGWTQMTSNTIKTLYSVWGTSATNVYAVGIDGTIMHYDGTAWAADSSGTTNKLNAVWGSSETNIYAVGEKVLLHKQGTGTTWGMDEIKDYKDPDTDYSNDTFTSVRGIDANRVYAGFSGGYLFWFDGTGWTNFEPELPYSYAISGIWPFTSTNIYATRKDVNNAYGIINRFQGGANWSNDYEDLAMIPSGIWASATDNIYVAGKNGLIIRFNGSSWLGVSSSATKDLNAISGSTSSNIFAVGKEGTIVHNKGAGFVDESFNTVNDLFGVWAAPDGSAYAVGTDGMILKYTPDPVATTTTTTPGGTTTTTPGGTSTTTSVPGGTTTTIPGSVTTSIVPPGEVGADFIGSPLTGKAPLQVQFTNLSGGDIATYQWVFGDGGVSTEKNPSHVYEKAGTYSVILTVIGTNGKTETKTRDSYISVKRSCALAGSLANQGQLDLLRSLRDNQLETAAGLLLTSLYYRNTAEINRILDDYPEMRVQLRELVGDNIDIFGGLLRGEQVVLSAAVLADAVDFLDGLSARGSMALQRDVDLILTGIHNGYFLTALGITLE